jgi:hypothetical protein
MAFQKIGVSKIQALLYSLDSPIFDPEVFEKTGVFVIRSAIPFPDLSRWRVGWDEFYTEHLSKGKNVSRFNPVSVDLPMPLALETIHQSPALLDIVEQVFGPNLALYNQRFVVKDKHRLGDVFVHQDFPYHYGWPNKASAFVALGPVNQDNGSMYFYPGTHQFGYLADAGELDPSALPDGWPVISPSLTAGDVVLMHSATWHGSHPFSRGPDRVLVDIIYQPADDPSSVSLLRGKWQTELRIDHVMKSRLFKRSRVTRMVALQRQLDTAEAELAALRTIHPKQ